MKYKLWNKAYFSITKFTLNANKKINRNDLTYKDVQYTLNLKKNEMKI